MIRRRPNPVLAGKDVSLDELAIRLEHGNAFCLIELPSVVEALTCELGYRHSHFRAPQERHESSLQRSFSLSLIQSQGSLLTALSCSVSYG